MRTVALDPRAVTFAQQNLGLPGTSSGELRRVDGEGDGVSTNRVGLHQKVVGLAVGVVASGPHLEAKHSGTGGGGDLVDKVQGELATLLNRVRNGVEGSDVHARRSKAV